LKRPPFERRIAGEAIMNELSRDLLDEIVRRLVDALHPAGIYLFGSHASGTPDKGSDIDLLVVVDDGDVSCRELARKGRRSLWGMCVPTDLVVCTTEEMEKWSHVSCNLLHTVAEKGQRIYARGR
jgi:predicted nucleotidyltransferase